MNVIIMRGLPGSGKSTWIEQAFKNTLLRVCSADHYFTSTDGKYLFDKTKIGEAHASCFRRFLDILRDIPDDPIPLIVDNTNIRAYEIAPYMQAAAAYGVSVEIMYLYCDPKIAAERCIHSVPREVIFGMQSTLLTEQLPVFWKQSIVY